VAYLNFNTINFNQNYFGFKIIFIAQDFMTGVPAVPGTDLNLDVLYKMVSEIRSVSGISRVLYDLTPKPPGTTEWE
jgi:GMP synthase (glutamine-hydrolysing)